MYCLEISLQSNSEHLYCQLGSVMLKSSNCIRGFDDNIDLLLFFSLKLQERATSYQARLTGNKLGETCFLCSCWGYSSLLSTC